MRIGFYVLTYNRPLVLQHCLQSLYGNTSIRPQEAWVIDDGSEQGMQRSLVESCIQAKINVMLSTKNYGIGYSFERLYNLIWQDDDLDIACIIESDYIWRQGWLEDVVATFKASPHTLAIAGTDHPDMYDRAKTHTTFPDIMKEQFGHDLESRDALYKPFDLATDVGSIKVQGVSNSCGCMMLNWKRMKAVIQTLEDEKTIGPREYKQRMDRAFNKGITHDTRRNASDGHMSSIVSMFGEKYLKYRGLDVTKDFPFLSICDYSISEHVCGGGVNGLIVPEGSTFIHSPTWKQEYLTQNPRTNAN
jgi:glycosyltransferase involved in cell wall biosynthesis